MTLFPNPRGIRFRIALCVMASVASLIWGFRVLVRKPLPELTGRVVEIKSGWGMAEIAQSVFESDRLHRVCFKVHVLSGGHTRRLKAGEYPLERDSIQSLTQKLIVGKALQYRVTVSEGTWSDDIAKLLAGANLGDQDRFRLLICDPAFVRSLVGPAAPSLEGYLFPETYFFTRGMKEEDILKVFVARFNEKVRSFFPSSSVISLHDVLTLASMVEKEAAAGEERPVIAGIFFNRLRKRMPLESCVTVEYALGSKKKHLTDADLQVDSPYNTYKRVGLPPGPVCNPGLAAIRAVLDPAESEYLFFVARGDGRHAFSKTWAEHKRAKREIQLALRKRRTLSGKSR